MEHSADEPHPAGAFPPIADPAAALELCELASSLTDADEGKAVSALELAARIGGADAALFVWVAREDDEHCWYRSIAALDNEWTARVVRRLHEGPCNWLGHVARSSEPILVREPDVSSSNDGGESACRDDIGRTAWLVPAPSPQGSDVLGLLVLAGPDEDRLDVATRLLPVFRALALGLSDWFMRRARDELVRGARLTDRDLDLLRRESLGHGSKRIAAALSAEAKTIDCRFHRLNVRLGVASRRDAVQLCRRYGLL